jgi:two-component system chemotaxis response regulator CheY
MKGKRILIVDDSAMMRKVLVRLLGGEHTIVGKAKDGAQALELYKTLKPDLVTMDITMQGIDGITAAQTIQQYDPSALIIFISNLDEDKYRSKVEELGAVGFVNKHHPKEILDLVSQPKIAGKP